VENTQAFIRIVETFIRNNPTEYIGVHCTHGFNRTGFLICSYLVEKLDFGIDMAIALFGQVRQPGIYKQDYINELFRRYGDGDGDGGEIPQVGNYLPTWEVEEDTRHFTEGTSSSLMMPPVNEITKRKQESLSDDDNYEEDETEEDDEPDDEPEPEQNQTEDDSNNKQQNGTKQFKNKNKNNNKKRKVFDCGKINPVFCEPIEGELK
jgi:hypothetical protein